MGLKEFCCNFLIPCLVYLSDVSIFRQSLFPVICNLCSVLEISALFRFCMTFSFIEGPHSSPLHNINSHICNLRMKFSYFGKFYLISQQPLLVCSNGNFKDFLSSHIPVLQEKYWPTVWCFESRLQTALANLVRSVYPKVKYHR